MGSKKDASTVKGGSHRHSGDVFASTPPVGSEIGRGRAQAAKFAGPRPDESAGPPQLRGKQAQPVPVPYDCVNGVPLSFKDPVTGVTVRHQAGPPESSPLVNSMREKLSHDTASENRAGIRFDNFTDFHFPIHHQMTEDQQTIFVAEQAQAGAFGGGPLAIGGESAGAYLAVTTLLRLRDQHAQSPFAAALLNYGAFDLSLTPSARNWGDEYMILSTPILRKYLDMFVGGHADRTAPEVSPLHARLNDLPPAFFMVGTLDPLLDDSLFMAQRWMAAGNHAQLEVFAGGLHAFNAFPIDIAREAASCQSGFLNKVLFAGETCP